MAVSSLGFAIDSSQAATAADDLDKLTSSAARVEQAAGKTGAAGTRMSQSFGGISAALDKIVSGLDRLEKSSMSIDSRLEAMAKGALTATSATKALGDTAKSASDGVDQLSTKLKQAANDSRSFGDQAAHVTAFRNEIDRLTAQYAPLQVAAKQYQKTIADIQQANRLGVISSDEMAAALTREKAAYEKVQKRKPGDFQTANITSQFQDIGVTAFGGSSPSTIALQQGTQLASALSTSGGGIKGAAGALAAGFGSLLSPLSIATVAFTGLAAAGIQYALNTGEKVKDLDDVLADHAKYIKAVEDRYGALAEKARGASVESANVLNFQGGADKRVVKSATNRAQADVFEQTGAILSRVRGGTEGGNDLAVDSTFKPVEDALRTLRAQAKAGKPDFDAFYDSLYKAAAADPKFAKRADELAPFVEKLREGTKALQEMERIQRALFDDRGPTGTLLSRGTTNTADMGNYAAFQKQQEVAAARNAQALDAQIASINARSPDEKANAAGATAAAVYNNDETPTQTRQRVASAITLSQVQSEKELADAQRDRSLSLEKLLDDQKNETSLIGQTANATDDLRQKYSLTAALRAEAARKGITDEQEFQKVYGGEIAQIDKVIDKQRELITQRDMMMSRTNAAVAQTKYDADNVGTLADLRRTQGAALGAIGAKTPQQIADAARARVLAEPVDPGKESQDVREYRASSAAALAYAQAEDQLKEAQKSRSLNLEKMLDDQRNETALIGQTGGAAAALRKEYELTSAAKLEAAQRGAEVDGAELANIKAKAAELGKLTDAYNQQKFTFDLNQQKADARLNPRDQQITTQLRQAGLPEDLNSANAKAAGQSIDWAANKAATKSFLNDFEQNLISNGGKIGKSFAQSLKTALLAESSKLWDGIFDKLGNVVADWLTGKSGTGSAGATSGIGAIGAVGGKLLGVGAANDNFASAGKTKTGIDLSKIGVDGLSAKVASTAAPQFQGLLNDLKAKGYPITSLGEGGYSFRNVAGTNHLSNHAFGDAIDINPRQNPQAYGATGNWSQYGIDPTAEAKKFGLTYGGNWNKPDTMHFQVDKAADASKALEKLAGSSTEATKGLGQLGQLSSNIFPAAPSAGGTSGGGFGGWLSSLFGGAFKPNGAQATKAASGGITGLFAGGTNYAPGGMAIVGEQGPELVDLNAGDRVINNNGMRNMMGSSGGNSHVTVGVAVDNNGNLTAHVKSIVHSEAPGIAQNAAKQTVGDYDKHQVRGGFGDNNRQYANRKG